MTDLKKQNNDAALSKKLIDAQASGFQAEFAPDEAESAGAFVEDALSAEDAIASTVDIIDVSDRLQPCFLDDDGYSEVPPFITVIHAHEMFDIKEDETLLEAITRYNAEHNDKEN